MVGREEAATPSEKDVELAATGVPDEEKPLSQSYKPEETAARRHSESQDEAAPEDCEDCEDCADRCGACCSAFASRWVGPIVVVFLTFAICAVCQASLYQEAHGAALKTLQILQYGLAGLALVFLALTNCTDPGSVVLSDQVDMLRSLVGEKEPEGALDVQKDVTQEDGTLISYRWCSTCRIYRPPRASHCRECNRCFMRFDHHCPWVGNCIAESNHRFFTGFLTTVSIAGLCVPAAAAASGMESGFVKSLFTSATEEEEGSLLGIFGAFFLICLICLLISCSGLACFAVEQCFQLLSDITTKERYGREQKEMDCSCLGGSMECHLRQICFGPMRCRSH